MATTQARTIPVSFTLPRFRAIPERPTIKTTEVSARLREFAVINLIVYEHTETGSSDHPYSRKEIPPITGSGIVLIRAASLPRKEQQIERTAAPPMT